VILWIKTAISFPAVLGDAFWPCVLQGKGMVFHCSAIAINLWDQEPSAVLEGAMTIE
jgi:hypothetical protein